MIKKLLPLFVLIAVAVALFGGGVYMLLTSTAPTPTKEPVLSVDGVGRRMALDYNGREPKNVTILKLYSCKKTGAAAYACVAAVTTPQLNGQAVCVRFAFAYRGGEFTYTDTTVVANSERGA